jgi:hypothetical protein
LLGGCPYAARKVPFYLARRLREVPGAEAAVLNDPALALPAVVSFCRTLEAGGFRLAAFDCSGAAHRDVLTAMIDAWGKMRPGALVLAFEQARAQPIGLRPSLAIHGERFRLVMSAGWHLQRGRPGQSIMLPVKPLGALLRCDRSLLTPILGIAKKHKVLTVIAEHFFKTGKATEYTFDLAHPALIAPTLREPGEDSEDEGAV